MKINFLLVGNEASVFELSNILKNKTIHAHSVTSDCRSALEKIKTEKIDVVIVDIHEFSKIAFDAVKTLSTDIPDAPDIYVMSEIIPKNLEFIGANKTYGVLSKPVNESTIAAIVTAWLAKNS